MSATNRAIWVVQKRTRSYGWCVVGFGEPYGTQSEAERAMTELQALAPTSEFRVSDAFEVQS